MSVIVETMAGELYTVYNKAVGGKAWDGQPLPDWDEFSTDEAKTLQADGWRAVARAVIGSEEEGAPRSSDDS